MKMNKWVSALTITGLAGITLGSTVALAGEKGAEYTSEGTVQFIPNNDPTNPVDPTNPDPENPVTPVDPLDPEKPINPGTNGPLSIDFASSFNFGVNKISNKNATHYARAQKYNGTADTPNYVQVSDNRGTNAGWTLKVKQDGQFESIKPTLNNILTGAQMTMEVPTVNSNSSAVAPIANQKISLNPNGEEIVVLTAADQTGAGTWNNMWGTVEKAQEKNDKDEDVEVNVTKDVKLEVPGSTPKDAVAYQTQLVWILTDAPVNP